MSETASTSEIISKPILCRATVRLRQFDDLVVVENSVANQRIMRRNQRLAIEGEGTTGIWRRRHLAIKDIMRRCPERELRLVDRHRNGIPGPPKTERGEIVVAPCHDA